MSNKVKRIAKDLVAKANYENFLMENSTAGSVLLTAAKLSGIKENKCFPLFEEAQKQKFDNIKELCDYFFEKLNVKEEYKKDVVLVYDENNKLTPIVTICIEASTGPIFLPVGPQGSFPTIMRHMNEDNIKVEYIYREVAEDEEENKEDA